MEDPAQRQPRPWMRIGEKMGAMMQDSLDFAE
jgi:hypothetical protein